MQNSLKNKQTLIIISVVVFVLLLAVVPILIQVFSDKDDDVIRDNPDTGTVLSGTYSINDGSVGYAGSSEYTFDGDKVTNVYIADGEQKTVEYTYVIAIENGVKVIKLTTVNEDGSTEVSTHEFEQGKYGDTPIIMINDVIYYLKND